MKAKITDVKKIVLGGDSNGSSQCGIEPPKNIEVFSDKKSKNQPGEEEKRKKGKKDSQSQEGDSSSGNSDKNQGQEIFQGGKKDQEYGKEQKQRSQSDKGDETFGSGKENDEMFGSGEEDDDGSFSSEGDESSGSSGGEERVIKEIDPILQKEYKYERSEWKAPDGKTIIGEVLPAGSLGDTTERDPDATKEKWEELTTAAISQSRGNIPGGIRKAIERLKAPVVDWREELKKYIDAISSKSEYVLPSRRFLGSRKALYGYRKSEEEYETIVVAIDTSGSISDDMVVQFLSEVKEISERITAEDLYIIFCHTRVYRVDHLKPGDPIQVGKLESGGTEFYPPFKWVEKNLLSQGIIPSVFIYFTDGLAEFPKVHEYQIERYQDRVIWVFLTFNGEKYPNPQPFGERIDITLANKGIKTI